MDYKGLRDPHLNVFWSYGGRPELENDITKAFINTIDGLDLAQKKALFRELFGILLDDSNWTFEYFLQSKPNLDKVRGIPDDHKVMFCFSPTGESWGYEGQDIHDDKKVMESILKHIQKENPSLDQESQKKLADRWFDEYLRSSKRNGSIPDGWIFAYRDSKLEYAVAMEDKLYNLDPNQIHNHMVKSLLITDETHFPVYCKYKKIFEILFHLGPSWIADQYLEYMTILRYRYPESLAVACTAESSIRRSLARPFGKDILKRLREGEVDNRDYYTWRIHLKEYPYLFELNLQVLEEGFAISLCFGPTQNSGWTMLRNIDSVHIEDPHLKRFATNFHLLYQRGKNIWQSYPNYFYSNEGTDEERVNGFISYWKKNLNLIKRMTPEQAGELYEKLYEDHMIDEVSCKKLKDHMVGKKNLVLVVPEIETKFLWTYEEMAQMSEEELVEEMKQAINKALAAFHLQ